MLLPTSERNTINMFIPTWVHHPSTHRYLRHKLLNQHMPNGKLFLLSLLISLGMIFMVSGSFKLAHGHDWQQKLVAMIMIVGGIFLLAYVWTCRPYKRFEKKQVSTTTTTTAQSIADKEIIVMEKPVAKVSSGLPFPTETIIKAYKNRLEPQELELVRESKISGFYVYPKKSGRLVEFVPPQPALLS